MAGARVKTGPPDFVGVGAQRSGTTWWFRELLGHPDVRAPWRGRKEVHFFDQFCARQMRDADLVDYYEWFRRRPGQVVGEWTPRYMSEAWVPGLLRRAAPEAKLLLMLRDPIERYRSGVAHEARDAPGRRREIIAADAIARGRYASQLRRLRRVFDPERILVLQYERCLQEPLAQYARTLRFLGVDDTHRTESMQRVRGRSTAPAKEPLWRELNDALLAVYEPEVRALQELVPELDVALWPNFAHLAAPAAVGA